MFVNRLLGRIHHRSSQGENALSALIQDGAGLAFRRPRTPPVRKARLINALTGKVGTGNQ